MNHICVVGAGNIGIATAIDLSKKYSVILLSKKASKNTTKNAHRAKLPNYFQRIDANNIIQSNFIEITSDFNFAFKKASIVIVTLPSFLMKDFICQILPYNPKIIFYFPGYGGKECFSNILFSKNITIAGLERVPYVARLTDDIAIVKANKKEEITCGVIKGDINFACNLLEDLLGIKVKKANNYLNIAFSSSNPILHTARIYALFKDSTLQSIFSKQIKFYANWNDFSSKILIDLDKELESIASYFHINAKTIRSHYNAYDIKSMSAKISSIKSLSFIESPLKQKDSVFVIDSQSRYFCEDFAFGLCILRGFGEIARIKTHCMDKILRWFERFFGVEYFDKNGNFCGKDLAKTGIPQNFGLNTKDDILRFYGDSMGGGGEST